MDRAAFVQAVADISLARVSSTDATADELFSEYDRVFRSLADVSAPARTVRTRLRPLTPRFDSECMQSYASCRRLERRRRPATIRRRNRRSSQVLHNRDTLVNRPINAMSVVGRKPPTSCEPATAIACFSTAVAVAGS